MVFLGVGLPDDQIHAPNEKVTPVDALQGAEAAAHLWAEFAALGRDRAHRLSRHQPELFDRRAS